LALYFVSNILKTRIPLRTFILLLSIFCLTISFNVIPPAVISRRTIAVAVSLLIHERNIIALNKPTVAAEIYSNTCLGEYGLSLEAFEYAWRGYQTLLEKELISRSEYLSICDFSQSSRQKRFYLIDIENKQLIINTYVAHGRNSGGEYANKFSNRPESHQSSLGFYITENSYVGEHGLALRIKGVDPGFNDRAFQRNIVIHGADYAEDSWLQHSQYLGRSYGCPALPKKETSTIINTIRNGSCLFIYHPGKTYLNGSKILNG
jgi:hypothetical protein